MLSNARAVRFCAPHTQTRLSTSVRMCFCVCVCANGYAVSVETVHSKINTYRLMHTLTKNVAATAEQKRAHTNICTRTHSRM